jgi:hypothetical protein
MRKILVVLAAALSGCSVIGHEKVEGWPQLEVVEHYVPHAEMRDRCAPYVGFGMSPEACAEFDLVRLKCHIWFSADFPPQDFIVKHERMHCAGYDHVGSTGMQRYLSYHQSRGLLGSAASAAAGASR